MHPSRSPTPWATRRGLLLSAPLLGALPHVPRPAQAAAPKPILDQPMNRLRLPQGTVGRDYVLVQLRVGGRGPFDFMLDTGLTAELITPHLRGALGLPPSRQRLGAGGMGAGGSAAHMAELVQLKDASLVGAEGVELPPLTAVVTDFLQEHLDPAHDPVEGMLGMELLSLFDVDFDFPAQRLRFFLPGEGTAAAAAAGLAEVPAAVLNETGVLGLRATSSAALARAAAAATSGASGAGSDGAAPSAALPLRAVQPQPQLQRVQPFVGILDCGASFSVLNWQAAALAGLPPRGDPLYRPATSAAASGGDGSSASGSSSKGAAPPESSSSSSSSSSSRGASGGSIAIVGVDGRPQVLPLAPIQFTFVGSPQPTVDSGGSGGRGALVFAPPPPGWQPWDPVLAAVGDLPVFAQLLGDGRTPFGGPAALVGLDVLAQRRVVFGAGAGRRGRARQLFVSPATAA